MEFDSDQDIEKHPLPHEKQSQQKENPEDIVREYKMGQFAQKVIIERRKLNESLYSKVEFKKKFPTWKAMSQKINEEKTLHGMGAVPQMWMAVLREQAEKDKKKCYNTIPMESIWTVNRY